MRNAGTDSCKHSRGMRMTDLKPCPFCGGDNLMLTQDGYGYWGVECLGRYCHAYVSNAKWACEHKEDAIELWNRRPEDDTGGGE